MRLSFVVAYSFSALGLPERYKDLWNMDELNGFIEYSNSKHREAMDTARHGANGTGKGEEEGVHTISFDMTD